MVKWRYLNQCLHHLEWRIYRFSHSSWHLHRAVQCRLNCSSYNFLDNHFYIRTLPALSTIVWFTWVFILLHQEPSPNVEDLEWFGSVRVLEHCHSIVFYFFLGIRQHYKHRCHLRKTFPDGRAFFFPLATEAWHGVAPGKWVERW